MDPSSQSCNYAASAWGGPGGWGWGWEGRIHSNRPGCVQPLGAVVSRSAHLGSLIGESTAGLCEPWLGSGHRLWADEEHLARAL